MNDSSATPPAGLASQADGGESGRGTALEARSEPAAELRARRETKEAIRRARRSASEREGNVVHPKAFKGRRRDLH